MEVYSNSEVEVFFLRAPQGRAAWPLKADAPALEACGIVLLPEAPHRARHSRESEPRLSASLSVTTSYGRVTRKQTGGTPPIYFLRWDGRVKPGHDS